MLPSADEHRRGERKGKKKWELNSRRFLGIVATESDRYGCQKAYLDKVGGI
jgi:hypothetical protein